MEILVIDTNIWCYYFCSQYKEHDKVARFLDKVLEKKRIAINTIIAMEVAHFLVKSLGSERGSELFNAFLSFPMLVFDFTVDDLQLASQMLARYSRVGIGGRDATILAMMKSKNIKAIATHDKAFKKVKWIKVVDPLD